MHGAEYSGAVHHPPAGIQPHSHTEVHLKKTAELGTRQHCCDNVTMFSGQKKWLILSYDYIRCGYFIYRYRGQKKILVPDALYTLSRYCDVVVAKLKIVASPALHVTVFHVRMQYQLSPTVCKIKIFVEDLKKNFIQNRGKVKCNGLQACSLVKKEE